LVTRHHPDAFATEGELNRIPEPVGEIERLGAVLWSRLAGVRTNRALKALSAAARRAVAPVPSIR